MLKSIGTTFITGFITILPVVLTIYLLYWGAVSSEEVMATALRTAFPDIAYFPGLGTIVGLLLVFIVGVLMKAVLVRQVRLGIVTVRGGFEHDEARQEIQH